MAKDKRHAHQHFRYHDYMVLFDILLTLSKSEYSCMYITDLQLVFLNAVPQTGRVVSFSEKPALSIFR
jgi:hypothetical protein